MNNNFLNEYQLSAVNNMFNGCILNGGVGTGKSRTSLYYYFKKNGGSMIPKYKHMTKSRPKDLYIITTARKRDDKEWEDELAPFLMYTDPYKNMHNGNKIIIDSWNNIKKYADVSNSFFIFDEQRVTGRGAWVNSFLKISKNNEWILLSATPGDKWEDYIPVFLANGFYKNRSEFVTKHLVIARFGNYPKVIRYLNVSKLEELRSKLIVNMDAIRKITSEHIQVFTEYDKDKYTTVLKNRWDPFLCRPIPNIVNLCFILRKICNSDMSRSEELIKIVHKHKKVIVFYSFDYERDILLNLDYGNDINVSEWSGHSHQPVPDSDKWVYIVNYSSGAEGWNCIKTNVIVFYSQQYSYKILEQSSGRINRMNTPYSKLYYYHFRSKSSIDNSIYTALKNKKNFNESIFLENPEIFA